MGELRDVIVYGLVGISAALYLYLLHLLLKGHVRAYPGLFLYVVVLVLTLVMDMTVYKATLEARNTFFLIAETARWGALYLVVLSFVWKALSSQPAMQWIRHWLILLSISIVFIAVYFTRDEKVSLWVLHTINILSVSGMLLNLILWTLLVRYRNTDLPLFLVTSGLGVQAALEAVAWSMRGISRGLFEGAYYVGILGHILCLLVWIMTFRRRPAKAT